MGLDMHNFHLVYSVDPKAETDLFTEALINLGYPQSYFRDQAFWGSSENQLDRKTLSHTSHEAFVLDQFGKFVSEVRNFYDDTPSKEFYSIMEL